MGEIFYQWVDLVWLPIGMFAVHKRHRLKTACFVLICVFSLRMQLALMNSIGYGETGMFNIMKSDLYARGLVAYSLVIATFLILAYYSQRTRMEVFLAGMLSIYISALCVTMLLFFL